MEDVGEPKKTGQHHMGGAPWMEHSTSEGPWLRKRPRVRKPKAETLDPM
jgi:hypothetical protein